VNSECGVLHVACVGAILKRIAIAIASEAYIQNSVYIDSL
jgi:hypothetical protein